MSVTFPRSVQILEVEGEPDFYERHVCVSITVAKRLAHEFHLDHLALLASAPLEWVYLDGRWSASRSFMFYTITKETLRR